MSVLDKEYSKRDISLDILKGLAIILVVLGHAERGLSASDVIIPVVFFERIDTFIYGIHMPIFFIVSGYLFSNSFQKKGDLSFVKKNVLHFLRIYFIWSFVQLGVQIMLSNYTNAKLDFGALAQLLYKPLGQFWFLYALVVFFLGGFLLFKLKKGGVLPLTITILVFLGGAYFVEFDSFIFRVLFYFPMFLVGIIYYSYKNKYTFLLPYSWPLVFFNLVVIVFYMFFMENNLIVKFLVGILSTLVLYIVIKTTFDNKENGLTFFGKHSLHIFILHIFFASGIRIILYNIFDINNWVVHLVLGLVMGLLMPIVIVSLIRRSKGLYKVLF